MSRLTSLALATALCLAPLAAQTPPEPDLAVTNIPDTHYWGTLMVGSTLMSAYSVGATLTNVGTMAVNWNPNTGSHPVISTNLYRLESGKFRQIGMSWVTHAGALPSGTALPIGASYTSSATTNGVQAQLGPRSEVNGATGVFAWPVQGSYPAPATFLDRRLQAAWGDVNTASHPTARFFVEVQVLHPDEFTSNTNLNSSSYREVTIDGNGLMTFIGTTHQGQPAIQAWKDADPAVQLHTIDIPGDGRVIVGFKGVPQNGSTKGDYHWELAAQNVSSDRSVGSVSNQIWPAGNGNSAAKPGTQMLAQYLSGEPYSNAGWTRTVTPISQNPGSITWKTTPYSTNPNASALRWGTLYNFSFDCPQLPGDITIGLFNPGPSATIVIPAFQAPRRAFVPYTVSSDSTSGADYVDISQIGLPGPIGNDNSVTVPIGFTFPFYFHGYTQAVISTNGYLTFPGQDGTVAIHTPLPSTANPHGMIAGYWTDLDCPNVFDVRYRTVNGNQFVVRWLCTHVNDPQPVEFEIVLGLDGSIRVNFVQMPGAPFSGATATQGIESPTSSEGLTYAYDVPLSAQAGQTVRYDWNYTSSDIFVQGSPSLTGSFKVIYSGPPNTPILTVLGVKPEVQTSLGPLGALLINPLTVVGVSDYYGVLTGAPDPTAVTNGSGTHTLQMWITPGMVPPGITFLLQGVDFPQNAPPAPNGSFDIANLKLLHS